MDVVYIVRNGEKNEELRYSLRSVYHNLQPDSVWIVGYKPGWVKNVGYVRGNPKKLKPANGYHNVLRACTTSEIPDEFVLFNDDFFVTDRVSEIPVLHRGSLSGHINSDPVRRQGPSWWYRCLASTQKYLKEAGISRPLSYELHVPFPVVKDRMAETLQRFASVALIDPPLHRSLYGNMHQIGGTRRSDCKNTEEVGVPFYSTDDPRWPGVAGWFSERFPEKCPYEV